MNGKISRKTLRLKNFDYSSNGKYFITVCTFGKENYFGEIENGKMVLSPIGQIVKEEIITASEKWNRVHIDIEKYVVMPNHVHMIISILNPETYHNYQKEEFGKPTPKSIPTIMRSYKSAVTKRVHETFNDLQTPYKIWQPRYFDNVIRNEEAYCKICEYIELNPKRWNEDKFYVSP